MISMESSTKKAGSKHMYESISLFSGAMGLDLGLEKAGILLNLCQDFDSSCYETMLENKKKLSKNNRTAIKE